MNAPTPAWPDDLQGVLQRILDQPNQLMGYDGCALFLLSGEVLSVAASRGNLELARNTQLCLSVKDAPELRDLITQGRPVLRTSLVNVIPHDFLRDTGSVCSCICAPLSYQDRPIGLFVVLKGELGYYTEKDAQSAGAFANQAAMAIENARLYTETRRRALHLEAASEVGQKITAILEPDTLLKEVVRLIQEKFGYYHVDLCLVDGISNEIVLHECSGQYTDRLKAQGLSLKIGEQGIAGRVVRTGRAIICNDVDGEPIYNPHDLLPKTQSELAVPLRLGDVVVGVLDVQSEQRDAFREDDLMALQILGDQVAVAFENARLFRETRHQFEAMRALHDIALDITSRLEAQQVLTAIVKQAAHLLNAPAGVLSICEPQTKLLRTVALHNVPPEHKVRTLRPEEGSVWGQALATGRPIIVNDWANWVKRNPSVTDGSSPNPPQWPYNAVLGVPLLWQGRVVGLLTVVDVGNRRPFTEDDARMLSLLASLASTAINNAQLYSQVLQLSQQLEGKVADRETELASAREELDQQAGQLQRLLAATVRVQEEERARIALDLHDGSNQLITGALFEIQAARESLLGRRGKVTLAKLETAKGLLRQIEAENRRIIAGLRPQMLDTQGLIPAVQWLANNYRDSHGIDYALKVRGEPTRLAPVVETAVYRIVQETLSNVVAHSQATNLEIRLDFTPAWLHVVVEDDGVGFDPELVRRTMPGRLGLIGMRERAQSIGGRLEVQSLLGKGTRIVLDVPLSAASTPLLHPA